MHVASHHGMSRVREDCGRNRLLVGSDRPGRHSQPLSSSVRRKRMVDPTMSNGIAPALSTARMSARSMDATIKNEPFSTAAAAITPSASSALFHGQLMAPGRRTAKSMPACRNAACVAAISFMSRLQLARTRDGPASNTMKSPLQPHAPPASPQQCRHAPLPVNRNYNQYDIFILKTVFRSATCHAIQRCICCILADRGGEFQGPRAPEVRLSESQYGVPSFAGSHRAPAKGEATVRMR